MENSYTLNIKPYNGPNDILKTTYIDLADTDNTLITSLNINIENQDIIAHDINGNHWYFVMPSSDVHVDIQASKRNSTGINDDVNLHENKKIDVLDDKLVIGNEDNNKLLNNNNNNNTRDDNNKFDLSDNSNDQEVSLEFGSVSSDLESVIDNNAISNDSTAIFIKPITSVLSILIIGIILALLACIPIIFIKKKTK